MTRADLPDLQAFAAVARRRSFRAAALELGVTPSALSHTLRGLEGRLGVRLLNRTTRSVAPTEAGLRLLERLAPALQEIGSALEEVNAFRTTPLGTLRLNAPRAAAELVLAPLVSRFLERHPGMRVEVVADDAFVDIVAEGFDAGVRLTEAIERDMVQVRLTDPFRFVVVASPAYLARHPAPARPEDLLRHDCITFRSQTTGALYAWELERGRRSYRVAVRGRVVTNDHLVSVSLATQGMGLAYAFEPAVKEQLQKGILQIVLEPYAVTVPGYFLYYPTRAQRSDPLRLFAEAAKELSLRAV